MPRAQVAEDLLRQARIISDRDDANRVLSDRAAQRVHMPRAQNWRPGGGMSRRGGAVCQSRAISAGAKPRQPQENHSAFCILHSAFSWRRGCNLRAITEPRLRIGAIVSTPHLLAKLRALAAAGGYSPFCIPLGCGAHSPA